jgi:hypothetical protein
MKVTAQVKSMYTCALKFSVRASAQFDHGTQDCRNLSFIASRRWLKGQPAL